jgi:hypothetical protein
MTTLEIRNKVHQLVDTASDGYLVEALDLLEFEYTSTSHKYSKEDIERFNQIAKNIENNPASGMNEEESFAKIRANYKNGL